MTRHLSQAELEAGLELIRAAPSDHGTVTLIVRRPRTDQREVVTEGQLSLTEGLVGDKWHAPADRDPEAQLTLMNARAIHLIAGDRERWSLAGDQLFVDLDLSVANAPPGTRLCLGQAIVEVSAKPHTGCRKFVARFGLDAMKFVNSSLGRQMNLRGVNAKVIQPGLVRVGDAIHKAP